MDVHADQTVLGVLADLTVLGVPARPPAHPQLVPDVAAALAHHQAWVGRAALGWADLNDECAELHYGWE